MNSHIYTISFNMGNLEILSSFNKEFKTTCYLAFS